MPRKAKATTPSAILAAAFDLIARSGWRAADTAAIAAAAGVAPADVVALAEGPGGLLPALNRIVDAEVVSGGPAEESAPARERLFDVLMRRFDALAPYRTGLAALAADRTSACLAPVAGPALVDSMAQMLALAGLDRPGIPGRFRAVALAGLWLAMAKAWMADDSADLTRTMAAVDRQLGRIERWL